MWYFYRIQNSEGLGPYRATTDEIVWHTALHNGRNGRPTLTDEVGEEVYEEHFGWHSGNSVAKFGFVTLGQMQSWFRPEELQRLEKLGFRACRVKGNLIVETPTQALFQPIT